MHKAKVGGIAVLAVAAAAGISWAVATRASVPAENARTDDAAVTRPADSAAAARNIDAQDLLLDARSKGRSDAPITIYEVSDFQCPYCRLFWEATLPVIERDYIQTGKARFIFLNMPLTQIHANAAAAHEFAMCAARQDRFWPVHDLLYEHQKSWADLDEPAGYFLGLADSVGLAGDDLRECFESGSIRWLIEAEAEMNWRAGVRSTPSFIVGGEPRDGERPILLAGAHPIENWRPLLDSLYAATTGAAP